MEAIYNDNKRTSGSQYIESIESAIGTSEDNLFDVGQEGWINRYLDYIFEKHESEEDNRGENNNNVENGISQELIPTKDNQGRKLSEQQQEYFKDSKVRDEDGNLKVMYHGTSEDNLFDVGQESGLTQNSKALTKEDIKSSFSLAKDNN